MWYVGIDDTDTLDTPGTGHRAREAAAALGQQYRVAGVVRHQLLHGDKRVPCTKNNSCKALVLDEGDELDRYDVLRIVTEVLRAQFTPGSDPGVCVARDVPEAVIDFARRAKRELVTQAEARRLAAQHDILLVGLGGTEDGVIGALSAVGLTAAGNHGRYIEVGRMRELAGLQPVSAVLAAGIAEVRTADGVALTEGIVEVHKIRPARREGQPVLVVEPLGDHWLPLKLD